MSLTALLAPLAVAAILGWCISAVHRHLPPELAARAATISLVAIAGAALPSLWLLSMSYLVHAPVIGTGMEWCAMAIGVHREVPPAIGLASLAIVLVGTPKAVRVWRVDRALRMHDAGPIEYVDSAEPYAVTVPGRGGRIVISTGLVDLISDDELDAVIAHERTHARHRHDRYLLIARTIAAGLPFIRPITTRLQYSLERWADEVAARSCGDRRLVATALAKVALGQQARPALLGFGGLGIATRVEAPRRRHDPNDQ
jgi:Zn-dependent protease with chaperone function